LAQNLENYIYLFFRSKGYNIFVGNLKDKEIDFIVENDKEKKYIQVTWSLNDAAVIEREFGNLELISDHFSKVVISMDDVSFGTRNGIIHQLAWEL
jgi:predicted AAA+ superfamily ATPase